MQMDNSEGKMLWYYPYMLINLDYKDPVYIGKNTPLAYVKDDNVLFEYLEVNEIVDQVNGINWCPPSKRKIVTSDLVYSPAQIMEHCTAAAEGLKCIRWN